MFSSNAVSRDRRLALQRNAKRLPSQMSGESIGPVPLIDSCCSPKKLTDIGAYRVARILLGAPLLMSVLHLVVVVFEPVTCNRPLRLCERHCLCRADLFVQIIFLRVLLMETWRRVGQLGPQIGNVV